MLAALPKAPSKYDPFKYPEIAKFRRNLVLKNLMDNNYINKNNLINLKKQKLNLKEENRNP